MDAGSTVASMRLLLDELNTIDGRRTSLSGLKKFRRDKVTTKLFCFLLCP